MSYLLHSCAIRTWWFHQKPLLALPSPAGWLHFIIQAPKGVISTLLLQDSWDKQACQLTEKTFGAIQFMTDLHTATLHTPPGKMNMNSILIHDKKPLVVRGCYFFTKPHILLHISQYVMCADEDLGMSSCMNSSYKLRYLIWLFPSSTILKTRTNQSLSNCVHANMKRLFYVVTIPTAVRPNISYLVHE